MENENDPKEKQAGTVYMPLGMCLGMAIGTAIGAATDNLSVWMCCGVSIGMCLGLALDNIARSKAKEETPSEENKDCDTKITK